MQVQVVKKIRLDVNLYRLKLNNACVACENQKEINVCWLFFSWLLYVCDIQNEKKKEIIVCWVFSCLLYVCCMKNEKNKEIIVCGEFFSCLLYVCYMKKRFLKNLEIVFLLFNQSSTVINNLFLVVFILVTKF